MKSLQPKNMNAQIVDMLGLRIIQGYYKEGQKLPVESELCVEFGVSRPIMREATKILSAKGLLVSRPRVGTVVKPRSSWNMLDREVLDWVTRALKPGTFLDMLFEARMSIEPSAAMLAAQKATKKDLNIIRLAYEDMARACTTAETIDPDIRFHQAVMDATHNDVIRYIGHTLHSALAISFQLTNWHADIHELSLPRHEAVYLAIAARDADAAAEASKILLQESRLDFDARNKKNKS